MLSAKFHLRSLCVAIKLEIGIFTLWAQAHGLILCPRTIIIEFWLLKMSCAVRILHKNVANGYCIGCIESQQAWLEYKEICHIQGTMLSHQLPWQPLHSCYIWQLKLALGIYTQNTLAELELGPEWKFNESQSAAIMDYAMKYVGQIKTTTRKIHPFLYFIKTW